MDQWTDHCMVGNWIVHGLALLIDSIQGLCGGVPGLSEGRRRFLEHQAAPRVLPYKSCFII